MKTVSELGLTLEFSGYEFSLYPFILGISLLVVILILKFSLLKLFEQFGSSFSRALRNRAKRFLVPPADVAIIPAIESTSFLFGISGSASDAFVANSPRFLNHIFMGSLWLFYSLTLIVSVLYIVGRQRDPNKFRVLLVFAYFGCFFGWFFYSAIWYGH